jgi:glycosyltransferase involved in cell wall biosynthesis
MTSIDVSVVLNIHRESLYLIPTLRSLSACVSEACAAGIQTELIAVFDDADHRTLAVFEQVELNCFIRCQVIEVSNRSLGPSRNVGINAAVGQYIWIVDADDVYSSNSLVALCSTQRMSGLVDSLVVYPEFLVGFGYRSFVTRYYGSNLLVSADFAFQHSYLSNIFLPARAFEKVRYQDLRLSKGFAYEDWHLNCELYALGYQFTVASDTILFYRQRADSLCHQADSLSCRLIPHTALFEPRLHGDIRQRERSVGKTVSRLEVQRAQRNQKNHREDLLASTCRRNLIQQAVALDPEIDLSALQSAPSWNTLPPDASHWGFALESAFAMLGSQKYSDVVVLPWLRPGGGEKFLLQILQQLIDQGQAVHVLILVAESASEHEWVRHLPVQCVFFDVVHSFPFLDDDARDALVMRLLLALAGPRARLHLKAGVVSHRLMDRFGAAIGAVFNIIYYRFCDDAYFVEGLRCIHPWAIRFLRRHYHYLAKVVSDCESIVRHDNQLLGDESDKYAVVYALVRAHSGCESSVSNSSRSQLLWASRLTPQKRPELLPLLGARLMEAGLSVAIHIYGLAEHGFQMDDLCCSPNLIYKGPFASFNDLNVADYDALLYTSHYDGLPNVILEAMASRLPVIAPALGGIPEIVIHENTGYLVPDAVDNHEQVDYYMKAIINLYSDLLKARDYAANATRFVAERHGPDFFARAVGKAFDGI